MATCAPRIRSRQLAVRVEQLKQDALEVSLLTLDAKGSEKQHQLQLKIDGKPVSGQLALQGSFDRQQRAGAAI